MEEYVQVPRSEITILGNNLIYSPNFVVSTIDKLTPDKYALSDEYALSIAKRIYKVFDIKCSVYYGKIRDISKNKDIIREPECMNFHIQLTRPLCISNLGNSLVDIIPNLVIGKGFGNPYYYWLMYLTGQARVDWGSQKNEFIVKLPSIQEMKYVTDNLQPTKCSIM
jgi:hypothetical protein